MIRIWGELEWAGDRQADRYTAKKHAEKLCRKNQRRETTCSDVCEPNCSELLCNVCCWARIHTPVYTMHTDYGIQHIMIIIVCIVVWCARSAYRGVLCSSKQFKYPKAAANRWRSMGKTKTMFAQTKQVNRTQWIPFNFHIHSSLAFGCVCVRFVYKFTSSPSIIRIVSFCGYETERVSARVTIGNGESMMIVDGRSLRERKRVPRAGACLYQCAALYLMNNELAIGTNWTSKRTKLYNNTIYWRHVPKYNTTTSTNLSQWNWKLW